MWYLRQDFFFEKCLKSTQKYVPQINSTPNQRLCNPKTILSIAIPQYEVNLFVITTQFWQKEIHKKKRHCCANALHLSIRDANTQNMVQLFVYIQQLTIIFYILTKSYVNKLGKINYLESNFGRHMGVQLSDNLNDSEELTRLKIKCKSAG